MESDCISGNWPQKDLPLREVLVAIKRKSSTNFILKKSCFYVPVHWLKRTFSLQISFKRSTLPKMLVEKSYNVRFLEF